MRRRSIYQSMRCLRRPILAQQTLSQMVDKSSKCCGHNILESAAAGLLQRMSQPLKPFTMTQRVEREEVCLPQVHCLHCAVSACGESVRLAAPQASAFVLLYW
jgi:hypothetical protein